MRQPELTVKGHLATHDGFVFSYQSELYGTLTAQPLDRKTSMANLISWMPVKIFGCMHGSKKKFSLIQMYKSLPCAGNCTKRWEMWRRKIQSWLPPRSSSGEERQQTQSWNQVKYSMKSSQWSSRGGTEEGLQHGPHPHTPHQPQCITGYAKAMQLLHKSPCMHASRNNHQDISAGEQWVPQTANIFYTYLESIVECLWMNKLIK